MSITVVLFVAMLAAIVINAEAFYNVLNNLVMVNLMNGLGWATSLVIFFMVVLCIVIMFTKIGDIKLGGPNAKPKFSYFQWFGISLCTGIGAGVVFWGAAEPLLFTMEPDPATGFASGSNQALLWSMEKCFLQWGLTPYASCVITGVILSYLILNKGAPFRTSSLLIPLLGDKVSTSRWADIFDAFCAFSLTAAVAGGLGYGAMQLSSAVDAFAGITPSTTVYIIIIAIMFLCYNASAISGLRNGITKLSNYNTQLFFILLIFVFLAGPTAYICNLFTESFGGYLNDFVYNSLNTSPYLDGSNWPQNWDMYWWVDWMAYAPLLGLFMVRVAYGRTLRQFILVEWLFPALFGIIWFSVFGGTILHAQLYNGVDFYTLYLEKGAEALTLSMFNVLPISTIAKIVMLAIITISLVTQCDSMAVTLAGMCYKGADDKTEAPIALKLFWGTVFAVIAVVFISLGGIAGVKTIKSFVGIPMTFIVLLITLSFLKWLLKRPRAVDGSFLPEPEVAEAPDNGEPAAKRSKIKFLAKLGF
ncbi:MAG: BCCT family transporter [Gemmiger sp.]